jgi:hypothetical protein
MTSTPGAPASLGELVAALRNRKAGRVLQGPFAGLQYGGTSYGSTYGPKLLGTYEMELAPWFSVSRLERYGRFIDVGCAEGYYTNGVAHAFKQANRRPLEILGFDLEQAALAESRRISQLNGLEVIAACGSGPDGASSWSGRTFVLCDVEGAEIELLDPAGRPWLREADLLVEVHDEPGQELVLNELLRRFPNHRGCVVQAKPRVTQDFPAVLGDWNVLPAVQLEAMDEKRVKGLRWLSLESRQSGVQP